MRISYIVTTVFFSISSAAAATIPQSPSSSHSDTTTFKRDWGDIHGINIWSTARAGTGAVQMTILGGLRLVPVLCDIFGEANYRADLANAFYVNIMEKIDEKYVANIIPVYKDANGPDSSASK